MKKESVPKEVVDFINEKIELDWTLGQVAEYFYHIMESESTWSNFPLCVKWGRLNFTLFAKLWIDRLKEVNRFTIKERDEKFESQNRDLEGFWFGMRKRCRDEKGKEKLYYIELVKGRRYLAQASDGVIWFSYTMRHGDKVLFTEKEIKDYDERFMAFAVEVSE